MCNRTEIQTFTEELSFNCPSNPKICQNCFFDTIESPSFTNEVRNAFGLLESRKNLLSVNPILKF